MILGKIIKIKKNIYKNSVISKNKNFKFINSEAHKTSRPFVVFYTNDKVYYLSVKTLTKENEKQTLLDKNNLILPQGIYDDNHPSVINCGSINIMDRALFERIYDFSHYKNNYYLDKEIYYQVIDKLNNNLDNLIYHEVDHIDFENNKTIWKAGDFHKEHRRIIEFVVPECMYIFEENSNLFCQYSNKNFYDIIKNELQDALDFTNIKQPKINHNDLYYDCWEKYRYGIFNNLNFGQLLESEEQDINSCLYINNNDDNSLTNDEDTPKFRM
ncbi:Mbov_0400 family ICE element protein [Mycoplasmopsis arginini]|uniref:Mbov_0400 family ICE element protein n=1 Tax=Mycoplasmopsis arginini TaxID=2094 RepID=UPI002733BF54|nr:hypothetical protein [Mycoplasmopsis arginini]MDP4042918.1 hypothetical protein [Mycoplasmopsis arginini]